MKHRLFALLTAGVLTLSLCTGTLAVDSSTKLEAVLFTLDAATGKCRRVERVDLWD